MDTLLEPWMPGFEYVLQGGVRAHEGAAAVAAAVLGAQTCTLPAHPWAPLAHVPDRLALGPHSQRLPPLHTQLRCVYKAVIVALIHS